MPALLPAWTAANRYGNGSTAELQAMAESISGVDLDAVFTTWLFTPSRPVLSSVAARSAAPSAAGGTAVAEPKSWAKIRAGHELLGGKG